MSRRFTFVSLALTAVVAFLVGTMIAGGFTPAAIISGRAKAGGASAAARSTGAAYAGGPALVSFAEIVERLNPAVVNIDATARPRDARRRGRLGLVEPPDLFDDPSDFGTPRRDRDAPRRGAGSGF